MIILYSKLREVQLDGTFHFLLLKLFKLKDLLSTSFKLLARTCILDRQGHGLVIKVARKIKSLVFIFGQFVVV